MATRLRCCRPSRAADAAGNVMPVRITSDDFDAGREIAALRGADARVGAVASFIGTVRDVNDDAAVSTMTLEHYPGMTEKALEAIVAAARQRFDISEALV